MMKKTLIAACLSLLTTAYSASAAEKNYSLTLTDNSAPVSVDIEIYTGSVIVEGYEGDTVEISANIQPLSKEDLEHVDRTSHSRHTERNPGRSTDGLKSVKSSMTHLEIEEDDNEVEISSEYPNQHVDLVVRVPMRASLEVELYRGGDIKINRIQGAMELESYKGAIYAEQISGPIVAETYNTDIVVSFASLDDSNPSSLTSHSGNLDISLAKSIAANVNVQSYQGEIFSGLSEEFVAVDEVKRNDKGKRQKIVIGGMMQAKVNGGGQDVALTSYSGNLYIRSN